MPTALKDVMSRLPVRRRRAIEARTLELIAEAMPLGELRKARRMTQAQMATLLDVGQDSVSRLEQRGDWRLSTLQAYVGGLGGSLQIVAHFPDRPSVVLLPSAKKTSPAPRRRGKNGKSRAA